MRRLEKFYNVVVINLNNLDNKFPQFKNCSFLIRV